MKKKQFISRDIEIFYNKASEETRLNHGMGVYEFERNKLLIEKHLPSPQATIIDVGGGTGKYSEWLAQKGHRVHMVEPILKHIQIAQNRAQRLKNKFSIHQGEACNLDFRGHFADMVILHGPLYHLQQRDERLKAIAEAKRVAKREGMILGFAINYTASTLVGLLNGLIHKRSFFNMCKAELTTGMHTPPDDFPWLLAEAYYHNPEKLRNEFTELGLKHLNTYAVEGMAWLDKNYFANMSDEKKKSTLLELNAVTETDPYLLALSPHMMIAAQKHSEYGG